MDARPAPLFATTRHVVREGVDTGGRINVLRVMVKALAGQPLVDYLERVPRDRPDTPLAEPARDGSP
jgi:hypothetical protein